MKFWLGQKCNELSDKLLADEHRSTHCYFGAMSKDFIKWSKHPLYGGLNPMLIGIRHEEQVAEMKSRGWKHKTPIETTLIESIYCKRVEWMIEYNGMMLDHAGNPTTLENLETLQNFYETKIVPEVFPEAVDEAIKAYREDEIIVNVYLVDPYDAEFLDEVDPDWRDHLD